MHREPGDMVRLRRDLQCDLCQRVFHKKFAMSRHRETVHGEEGAAATEAAFRAASDW